MATKTKAKRTAHQTAARDFTMARLAACRVSAASALQNLDDALAMFVVPDEDPKGKVRKELLEGVDDALGEAAASVQQAMEAYADVSPTEGEPETDDEDDDDDDLDDEDDDLDDEDD